MEQNPVSVDVAPPGMGREETPESLAESTRFLQSVIDGIQDSIKIVDRSYRILFVNRAAREKIGKEAREIVGLTCHGEFYNFSEPCPFCVTAQTFATGKPGHTAYSAKGEGGSEQFFELSTYPILDEKGQVDKVIEIARDVTERKLLEAQLVQSSKMVSLGELAGGLAHQLNNPLVGVCNIAQLLCDRMSPEDPNRRLAETIMAAGAECASIVKNLLKFSRDTKFDLAEVSINRVLQDVLSLTEKQIGLRGVTLVPQFGERLPTIRGNETQLAQVVLNIIQNAYQAMPEGGTLSIASRWEARSGEVVVTISDTGVGIPRAALPRIFDPFFTTKEEGTGLGLSVAYGIVKGHGGRIEVESVEGKGSIFAVRLPTPEGAGRKGEGG